SFKDMLDARYVGDGPYDLEAFESKIDDLRNGYIYEIYEYYGVENPCRDSLPGRYELYSDDYTYRLPLWKELLFHLRNVESVPNGKIDFIHNRPFIRVS